MISEPLMVLSNERLAQDLCRMTLEAPQLAAQARPGQFVTVRVSDSYDPLLRRPLGIHRVLESGGSVQLLYKVVGRGTELLAALIPGQRLHLLGPLGNGFSLPVELDSALLVAGGIGVAPLLFLAQRILARPQPPQVELFFGGRSAQDLAALEQFEDLGVKITLSTDDGSRGQRGLITELLQPRLAGIDPARAKVFACGPTPMLKRVAQLTDMAQIACEVSLERQMACGVGSCMGCVTGVHGAPLAREGHAECSTAGPAHYERVCLEGPVFDADKVEWSDG
ncbi:MAG: dihydroorotate dehydrogenase electron transfer subunit [Candidatus Alcyoniella australis]|nr:dihydroorotate dehydrogenase electron transfer subunit [Candidatus Alcyoniella australis]